jgi:hypothetical protein
MLFRNFIVSLFKESVNNWLVIVNEWNEIKEVQDIERSCSCS